jgi:DNA-binding LacI/PurR family transcriptional regulator
MAVRVRDIAQQAGVSVGAVSRALKGQPGLKEATRTRIVEVARRLGYDFSRLQSSPIKRVLFVLHRQHNIALALPFYSAVLLGAESACRERGIVLSVLATSPADSLAAAIRLHEPDAFLCAGFMEPERLALLKASGKPVVLADLWQPGLAAINPDNQQGGYLATRHLIDLGRRRIAFLTRSLAHFSLREREKGYRQALFEAKILNDPALEVVAPPGDDSEQGLAQAVRQLLALPVPPDALFACNDAVALIALRVCREAGIRVPEQLAIVGFDDIEAAAQVVPGLTTLAVDKAALGRQAVGMLLAAPEDPPPQRQLPVTLVVRGSSQSTG